LGEEDFARLTSRTYLLTVFGNHDDLELLPLVRNRDGSPVLLGRGEVRDVMGLKIAGISGIWAKSHRKPWYITDEEVAQIADSLRGRDVDVLITHGCPVGLADLTPSGKHGGQRCFLDAFRTISPKVHLCGHLHRKGIRRLKSGAVVANVGYGAEGDFLLLFVKDDNIYIRGRRDPPKVTGLTEFFCASPEFITLDVLTSSSEGSILGKTGVSFQPRRAYATF